MNNKILSIIVGIIFLGNSTFAKAALADFSMPSSVSTSLNDIMGFFTADKSSAQNRENKNYTFNVQMLAGEDFGFGYHDKSRKGFQFGKFLDSQSLILFNYSNGGYNSGNYFYNFSNSSSSFGVQYKKFFGNSFFVQSGLNYETFKSDYAEIFEDSSTGLLIPSGSTLDINSLLFVLKIGNHWQWSNFTLGCDWLTLEMPSFTTFNRERVWGKFQANSLASIREDKSYYTEHGALTFGKINLGVSW